MLSYFYPQLHINYQHSEIFLPSVQNKLLHCAVLRRTSWGNAHPSKGRSILVLRGPNCLLQGAESSGAQWAQRERQIPHEQQCPAHLGCWALVCSGTWGPDLQGHHWQLSTQEFLRFCLNRCGENAVLSYATAQFLFLCYFSYCCLDVLPFSLCTLCTHPKALP